MPNLLIVSHVPSANTAAMTRAVTAGVQRPEITGIEFSVIAPLKAGPRDVLWADGIILGTTENFGYMSGAMKDFFDRIYYPCLERTEGLPYAVFIRAGNDGLGAKTSMERIIGGLRWKQAQSPLICTGPWSQEFLTQCEELGMTMAAGLEAGVL